MKHLALFLTWLLVWTPFATGLNVYGELTAAQLEKLGAAPTGSEGRIYYNTVTKVAQIYDGTIWSDIGSGGAVAVSVGSIQQSILTLVQFQAQMGTEWVLMDGADITGSALAGITGNNTLPDATGRFLRSAGGSAAALAAQQADATAKNGLANASSTATGSVGRASNSSVSGTVSRTGNSSAAGQGGGSHNHSSSIPYGHSVTPSNTTKRFATSTNTQANWSYTTTSTAHTHNASTVTGGSWSFGSGSASGGTWTFSSGSAAAQTISGDAETRPMNLTVNTFIKIN